MSGSIGISSPSQPDLVSVGQTGLVVLQPPATATEMKSLVSGFETYVAANKEVARTPENFAAYQRSLSEGTLASAQASGNEVNGAARSVAPDNTTLASAVSESKGSIEARVPGRVPGQTPLRPGVKLNPNDPRGVPPNAIPKLYERGQLHRGSSKQEVDIVVASAVKQFPGDVKKATIAVLESVNPLTTKNVPVVGGVDKKELGISVQQAVIAKMYNEPMTAPLNRIQQVFNLQQPDPLFEKKIRQQVEEGQIPRDEVSNDRRCDGATAGSVRRGNTPTSSLQVESKTIVEARMWNAASGKFVQHPTAVVWATDVTTSKSGATKSELAIRTPAGNQSIRSLERTYAPETDTKTSFGKVTLQHSTQIGAEDLKVHLPKTHQYVAPNRDMPGLSMPVSTKDIVSPPNTYRDVKVTSTGVCVFIEPSIGMTARTADFTQTTREKELSVQKSRNTGEQVVTNSTGRWNGKLR